MWEIKKLSHFRTNSKSNPLYYATKPISLGKKLKTICTHWEYLSSLSSVAADEFA